MVPHLITALNGPINELEQRILDTTPAIERWFRLEWMEHTPPFYCSVDVRNAGFKLAPVDSNLFPDGWNNLTPDMLPLAVQAGMAAIEKICPEARNLLILPKNQPQNSFYWANVLQLKRVFHQAGLNVRFGSLSPDVNQNVTLNLPAGESVTIEPLIRTDRRLGLKDFDPCTILLNNDLSAGIPGILEDLNEQYLLPPLHATGSVRRKSLHFKAYEEVSKRFGKLLGVDPWLINPMFAHCRGVNFTHGSGMDCLSTNVDALLTKVKRKYKEYGIHEKPFVVVKADGGSAGMGIMTVRDVKDLDALIGQAKARAGAGKGLATLPEVIIQEGVLTHERVNAAVAEPVVYMMDRYVVGGFYRIHAERTADESLSVPGSSYVPLAFADSGRLPQHGEKPGSSSPNRFYMYGVIARLAMLAASYELEATDPNAEVYD
ncbi:MAG: glutamate--cysteine ligase [Polaromonas sp.]|nr:MAG: glutamate--cysteine ligase [Polaromonas sp.]